MSIITVKREAFLRALEMVSPAIESKDTVQQSTCIVFSDGWVFTFNGELSCCYNIGLPKSIDVAMKGKKLMSILAMSTEEDIELEFTKDSLYVDSRGKTTEIRLEPEVLMPLEVIEPPSRWNRLHVDFAQAVNLVNVCCSDKIDTEFDYNCVRVHPEWVEAASSFRASRYRLDTGIEDSGLIQRKQITSIVGFGMTQVSTTDNWYHFKNPAGLEVSCRRHPDDKYRDITSAFNFTGEVIKIPKSIKETSRRAEIFLSEMHTKEKKAFMVITIDKGVMSIEGRGISGAQLEDKKVTYSGNKLSFGIPTDLMMDIIDRGTEVVVGLGRIKIDRGEFIYACGTEEVNGRKQ